MTGQPVACLACVRIFTVATLLAVWLTGSLPAVAATRLVGPDGSDAGPNDCTNPASPCATLGHALQQAAPNDTIQLAAGTYAEPTIVIAKSVTVVGAGQGQTIVRASGVAFVVRTGGVEVRDLTIRDATDALQLANPSASVENITIRNVEFLENSQRGILLEDDTFVRNLLVSYSTFTRNQVGILLSRRSTAEGITIEYSTFQDQETGFQQTNDGDVGRLTKLLITCSVFRQHRIAGVYGEEVREAVIERSEFTANRRAIHVAKIFSNTAAWPDLATLDIRSNAFVGDTDGAILLRLATAPAVGITLTANYFSEGAELVAGAAVVDVGLRVGLSHEPVVISDNFIFFSAEAVSGGARHAVRIRGELALESRRNTLLANGVAADAASTPSFGYWLDTDDAEFGVTQTAKLLAACNTVRGFDNGVSVLGSRTGAWGGLPEGAAVVFENNNLLDNRQFGLRNEGTGADVDARLVWWGHATGPSGSGPGEGDAVSVKAVFTPFLTTPVTCEAPRLAKLQLRDDIREFRAQVLEEDEGTELEEVIENLERSLVESYWRGDSHLSLTEGHRVFEEERYAVARLCRLLSDVDERITKAALVRFVERIVSLDGKLAAIAIAEMAEGDRRELARAVDELVEAGREAARGRYEEAIEHYRNAWRRAVRAAAQRETS